MAAEYPSTVVRFQMLDGEVEMTLQMFALYKLKGCGGHDWEWERYNKITQGKGTEGEFDIAYVLYTAYLCRCVTAGVDDRYGSFAEFLQSYPPDDDAVMAAYQAMRHPKKA